MERDTRDILKDIPAFTDLKLEATDGIEILSIADALCRSLDETKETENAEETRRELLNFQQKILEAESFLAYSKITHLKDSRVDAKEDAIVRDSPQENNQGEMTLSSKRETLENNIFRAKSQVYEALSHFPYERMACSSEDRDLWARAWRWKNFEAKVPDELFQLERKLQKKLKALTPKSQLLKEKHRLPNLAFDSYNAVEQRDLYWKAFFAELERNSSEREGLILQLLRVRTKIAQVSNYANYSEYHETRRGKRSFTRLEEELFVNHFVTYFGPLVEELHSLREQRWGMGLISYEELLLITPQGTMAQAIPKQKFFKCFRESLAKITSHEEHFLISLIDKQYVTQNSIHAETLSRSSTLLPSIPAAYLALPSDDSFSPVTRVFYNCGEALADISAMLNYHVIGSSNQDAFSKALSGYTFMVLANPVLDEFYDGGAEYAYDLAWSKTLISSALQIAVYSLENSLYRVEVEEELDIPAITELWQRISKAYLPFLDDSEKGKDYSRLLWQYLFSKATDPYQSLASVLAMVTLLAERPRRQSLSVLSGKLNQYLLTNPGGSIEERLGKAEFGLPFNESVIRDAAFSLSDILEL